MSRSRAHLTPSETASPRYWPTWTMLTVFVFIAFECALLAAALKGQWFILFAPATVCGVKAWDAWMQLKRAADGGEANGGEIEKRSDRETSRQSD